MENELDRLFPALKYGGERFSLAEWKHTVVCREETGTALLTEHEFISPDGLLKIRLVREDFRDFPAIRCRNALIGCGKTETRPVTDFDALDFSVPANAAVKIRAIKGSKKDAEDFSARNFALVPDDEALDFICDEGRSSANWMPYFGFDLDELSGYEVAVGWSGSWRLRCGISGGNFFCRAGMRDLATVVLPGETLIQPSVLILRRDGMTARDFQTVIHDFMVKHNSPRDRRGELQKPILPIGTSGGNHPPEDMKKIIAYAVRAQLPCDAVWVDAGWNGPEHHPDTRTNCGDCWTKFVGDWRVNPGMFPAGALRSVSDAAHAAGMRFLLWFEPERAMPGTPVFEEHPEYFHPTPVIVKGKPRYLLDLGNEKAWQYIFDALCRIIRENGIDIYRQDFNMDPQTAWAADDAPGRRGVSEIRHVSGLYRLWDALRAEFPDLLIDNCAAGGRRMDFELISRSHVYCRSDYFVPRSGNLANIEYTPEYHRGQIVLGQNTNVNTLAWVPFQASEMNCCTLFDDAEFFSVFGTGIVFSAPDWNHGSCECDFSEEETRWFRKMLTVADRVRKILAGKFLPLTDPLGTNEDAWAAFEGFLPEQNTGFAAFFRRKQAEKMRSFDLGWIDAAATYLVEDASTGEKREMPGAELQKFTVKLDKAPDGKLIFFTRRA